MRIFAAALLAGQLFSQPAPAPVPKSPSIPAVMSWRSLENSMATGLHWQVPKGQELLMGPEDSLYLAPPAEDIDDLIKFWRWRREGLGYVDNSFDCDDFAREAKHLATIWSVKYYGRTPAALAFGMVYVHMDGNVMDIWPSSGGKHCTGYHVLNVVLRNDGQWLFFEPESGVLVPVESMIYEGSLEILKVNL